MATIFLDVIYIGIFYPRSNFSDTVRFSAGMAILNLILKPISCFFVYHMYRERGGELLVHVGEATTSSQLPSAPPTRPGAGTAVSSPLLKSLPCPPPSPCPREPTLPPETGIQGAGWGLVWALGTRLKGVQVSGLLEEPRGPLAIRAWLRCHVLLSA